MSVERIVRSRGVSHFLAAAEQSVGQLILLIVLGGGLAGCKHYAVERDEDVLWTGGKLRVIANVEHNVEPLLTIDPKPKQVREEWFLITAPFPDRTVHAARTWEFHKLEGEGSEWFKLIRGSDLLIHGKQDTKFTLFDPQTGKDVGKEVTGRVLFNRSRTAVLAVVDGKAIILDTLSLRTGEPTVLATPPWAAELDQLKYGRQGALLTEDAKHLVLYPGIVLERYIIQTNIGVDILELDGTRNRYSIPMERRTERFVGGARVNGEILILTRGPEGDGDDVVRIMDFNGKTLHTERTPASSGTLWDPEAQMVLFIPEEFSPLHDRESQKFQLWNYSSNTLREVPVWK